MKTENSVHFWRDVSRRGVFEVLDALEQKGPMRFGNISKEVEGLCLATLTNALMVANKLGLVTKSSYKIADDGTLEEITEDDTRKGIRPQATLYKLDEKGKSVLALREKLGSLLGSA